MTRQPIRAINQDQKVIEFLRGSLTLKQVDDFIAAANLHQEKHGYTFWAAELKTSGELIGFIGLNYLDWQTNFTPATEIGWRLGLQFWGNGYATEGAMEALKYGFESAKLKEIIAITVPQNIRSIHVMEKIGMMRDLQGDFDHPKLPQSHKLRKHVLYRAK